MSKRENVSSSTQTKNPEFDVRSAPVEEADELPTLPTEGLWSQPNGGNADLTRPNAPNDASSTLSLNVPDLSGYGMRRAAVGEFFSAMQKWVGYVTEVGKDTFRSRITTMVGEGHAQDAEIYTEEVDVDDRSLIKPGATFYWSIGYLDRPSGRLRTSVLRFRRLPVWTDKEIEAAKGTIKNLKGLFES